MYYIQLCEAFPSVITYQEVLSFFMDKWAPVISLLHEGRGNIIEEFISYVFEAIKDLPTHEVSIIKINCSMRNYN